MLIHPDTNPTSHTHRAPHTGAGRAFTTRQRAGEKRHPGKRIPYERRQGGSENCNRSFCLLWGKRPGILLKCPYCPKWSTDSMQSVSKFQWHSFHKNRKYKPKICMKSQKTLNSQRNLERNEQSWGFYMFWFQTTWQSYNNQNSMVSKQAHS